MNKKICALLFSCLFFNATIFPMMADEQDLVAAIQEQDLAKIRINTEAINRLKKDEKEEYKKAYFAVATMLPIVTAIVLFLNEEVCKERPKGIYAPGAYDDSEVCINTLEGIGAVMVGLSFSFIAWCDGGRQCESITNQIRYRSRTIANIHEKNTANSLQDFKHCLSNPETDWTPSMVADLDRGFKILRQRITTNYDINLSHKTELETIQEAINKKLSLNEECELQTNGKSAGNS